MKIFVSIVCILLLGIVPTNAQNKDYTSHSDKADLLFKKKDFLNAVKEYSLAFASNNDLGKVLHRYRAASCWALLGNSDSAFYQLQKIANTGNFTQYELIAHDSNLLTLHTDKRWNTIIEKVKKNEATIFQYPKVN
jgi:hypothetical protein